MLMRAGGWLSDEPSAIPGATRLNALLALVLSLFVCVIASGIANAHEPQGGVFVCIAALSMTLPVAWRRRFPLQAVAVLAAAAVFNWLVVGSYVRCGAALPALFLCLFSSADRLELEPALAAAALALVSGIAQSQSDPQLKGFAIGAVVLVALLFGAGRLVRSRQRMVVNLRERTDALRRQREQTAQLAVAADRARLGGELEGVLAGRLAGLSATAAAARDTVSSEPDAAQASLAAIEESGRETLNQMREIVGTMREEQPTGPQPTLADLDALLERVGSRPAPRLTVEGTRVRLPAGVELSAFRIIERLLEPLEGITDARASVTVRYAPEALEVHVAATMPPSTDTSASIAAARQWAALHSGALESGVRAGVTMTEVRLPLISGSA
jgi:signal transduction histidine kinase